MPDNDNDNDYLEAVRKLRDWRERLSARPEHNWNVELFTHDPDEPFHYGSAVTLSAAQFGALLAMQGTLRDAFERGYRAGQYGAVLPVRRQVLTELADELLDRRERQALGTALTEPAELAVAVAEHYRRVHADNLTASRVAVESDVCRSVAATLQITPQTWRGLRVDRADLIALLRRAWPNARVSERSLIAIELDIEQPGDDDTLTRTELVDRIRNTRPAGGQEVREARAAERANILGQLGININPTAAPGTQGAVRQIRNWADAQAQTVERNTSATGVLQQLHDELFRGSRRTEIPVPVTVPAEDPAGYADWLRDHLAQDERVRRENLLLELGAGVEQAAEITDDEELRAFLVSDRQFTVVSTAHRIIRQALGEEAARAVLAADTGAAAELDDVIATAAAAVTAALQDRTPAPPAVRRYAELRRRYSADHDAHEHGTGHFTAAVFALLLNDDQRLTDVQVWADGSESFTCRAPAHLWPFANSPAGRCDAARRAREKPGDWRLIEAAALLMCAVDHGNEETTDA